jgi:tetratricopeptide (TPR) repeat protein
MISLWRRLITVDRAVWISSAGAIALVLSALPSWSEHPSASHSWISTAGELMLVEDVFAIDLLPRLVAFVGGLLFLVGAWRGLKPRRWHLRAAWMLPAGAFAFPCWLAHSQPERMLERKQLYQQMNRVCDDMDINLIEQQVDWRAWQTFSRRTLSKARYLEPPARAWTPAFFSAARANRVVEEVLGFSPAFLGFFRPALFAALAGGMALLLCGLHLAHGGGLTEVWRGLLWGLMSGALLVAVPLGPRIVAEYHLVASEEARRRGESPAALANLRAAQSWRPDLRYSWPHYHQLGQLARLQDRPTSLESLLADAYDALARNEPQPAVERLYQAQTTYPEERAVDRFLGVALAEAGIDAFNRGQPSLAKDYWEESLRYVPINPTPWYGLSLVHGRRQRHDESARCLKQLVRLQKYFGYKRLPVRSQALVTESWAAFQRRDLPAAHEAYSRSFRPETW